MKRILALNFSVVIALGMILSLMGCQTSTYLTPYTPSTSTVNSAPSATASNSTISNPTVSSISPSPSTLVSTTSSGTSIVIGFSGVITNQIGNSSFLGTPNQGYTFLVVTYTIQNKGYASFSVSPFYFSVIVNSIKYSYDISSYNLDNYLSSVTVMNGGTLIGTLAYQIPSSPSNLPFNPVYQGIGSYNIQWSAQSATAILPTTTSSNAIKVGFSGTVMNQIGSGSYPNTPKQGYTYLVVTYNIQNVGYTSFSVSPFDFSIIINSIKYDYDSSSYNLDNYLSSVTVMNGGTLTGKLAYQIPTSSSGLSFSPTWDGYGSYNIQWLPQ